MVPKKHHNFTTLCNKKKANNNSAGRRYSLVNNISYKLNGDAYFGLVPYGLDLDQD